MTIRLIPQAAIFGPPHRARHFLVEIVERGRLGVAFFDGFYYERTAVQGQGVVNVELTSGQARGRVTRGTMQRDEPWSEWLVRVYHVFGGRRGDPRIDVEFSRDDAGFILLQVRPALFPVRRNPLLTAVPLTPSARAFPNPQRGLLPPRGST